MKEAVGGILFIDEAYDLLPSRGSFNHEVVKALLENATAPEFHGKLIVIMAGYADKMDYMFKNCGNAGFASRFDKKRLQFPDWDASVATNSTVTKLKMER